MYTNVPAGNAVTLTMDVQSQCASTQYTQTDLLYTVNNGLVPTDVELMSAGGVSNTVTFTLTMPATSAYYYYGVHRQCLACAGKGNGNGNGKGNGNGNGNGNSCGTPPSGLAASTSTWTLSNQCFVGDQNPARTDAAKCNRGFYFCPRQADTSMHLLLFLP